MAITIDKEMEYKLERMKKSFTIEGKIEYLRQALEKHRRLAEWHEYQAERHRVIIKYIEALIAMLEFRLRRHDNNAPRVQA